LVTLGCTRNEVDSEELAGRLEAQGWTLVDDAADADVALVNTCGFVESAKKDSVDALLEAADLKASGAARTKAVVAVGCLAERYGEQLAASLPEADAVLGFDSYADMSSQLAAILAGGRPASHTPRDRRTLLPLSPATRQGTDVAVPGHGSDLPDLPAGVAPASGPRVLRRRLDGRPWAPLKIASGCDRRCAFCAIPAFRGAFLSRRPADVLAEARWLGERGVRELFLVSENSTSYGKDLGDLRLLETMLPELAAVEGIARVRVSYLQPAEMRPSLLEAMTSTPGVVPYFDLSFQHASAPLLRRMRRFGGAESFLGLLEQVRAAAKSLDYRANGVARSLRLQRTDVWALIISDIGNPFFTAVARGVEDVAQREGFSVVLCNTDENSDKEARYIDVAEREQVAGVIMSPNMFGSDISRLTSAGIPVVAIDRPLREPVPSGMAAGPRPSVRAGPRARCWLTCQTSLSVLPRGPFRGSPGRQGLTGKA